LRPLPDLTDVQDIGSVFDPQQDDLLRTIGSDLANYDSLTSSLDQQQNDLASSAGGVGSAIDTIDTISDAAGTVFDQLSQDLDSVDLTATIAESTLADALLSANLDGFNVDYGSLGLDLFKAVYEVVQAAIIEETLRETANLPTQAPYPFPDPCPPIPLLVPGACNVLG